MNPVENIKRAIQRLHVNTSSETDKRILDDAYSALDRYVEGRVSGCIWHSRLKRKVRDLIPVTVAILVVFTLFFYTLSSQAVVLEDINNALGQVRNVCIQRISTRNNKIYQTSWKSRPFRIWITDDIKYAVLIDLNSWTSMEVNKGIIYKEPVEIENHEKFEDAMNTSFGLIPFSNLLEAKTKGHWEQIDDADTADNIEVYELSWTSKTDIGDMTIYYKWRVYVDTKTDLPVKTEWYQKDHNDNDFVHSTTTIITYPTDNEIETVVKSFFGMSLNQLREPEDFEIPQINQIDVNVTR